MSSGDSISNLPDTTVLTEGSTAGDCSHRTQGPFRAECRGLQPQCFQLEDRSFSPNILVPHEQADTLQSEYLVAAKWLDLRVVWCLREPAHHHRFSKTIAAEDSSSESLSYCTVSGWISQ
jgi:hypothetical protein